MGSIGMMDPAYFVGKVELLNWLNDLLKLNYAKVEQGEVPLKKVNFDAKHEADYVKNFKVLQTAFDKKQISRVFLCVSAFTDYNLITLSPFEIQHVDVQKLTLPGSSSFIHNLEFLQWIKKYFDMNYGGHPYNAVERRGGAGASSSASAGGGVKENLASSSTKATASVRAAAEPKERPAAAGGIRTGAARVAARDVSNTAVAARPASASARPASAKKPAAPAAARDDGKQKLQEELATLKFTVQRLESERDFYFQKLTKIEEICQNGGKPESTELVENIQKVLYAEEEANPATAPATPA